MFDNSCDSCSKIEEFTLFLEMRIDSLPNLYSEISDLSKLSFFGNNLLFLI
jgi:hypothetical protein